MKLIFAANFLALFALPTVRAQSASDTLTDSMADCVHVAEQFRNTCTTPREVGLNFNFASSVAAIPGQEITCPNWPTDSNFPCIGWMDGSSCKWHRRTCVTCYPDQDGRTMIRVQTNSMPDHCPGNSLVEPQDFDYEVLFNSPVTTSDHVHFENEPTTKSKFVPPGGFQDVTYNNAATAEVCPLAHTYDLNGLRITEHGNAESRRVLAYAINGVAFQNANQEDDDPVFPQGLGAVLEQPLDICMGHNQRNGDTGMYHYHFLPPCLNPTFLNDKTMGECLLSACEDDPMEWALGAYQEGEWAAKKIIGLSKDGRPMYGPHDEYGQLWHPSDVDACNGVRSEGYYHYVTTLWHPYVAGCQGPTNMIHEESPPFYATCSLNGIEEYQEPLNALGEDCVANTHCASGICDLEDRVCTNTAPAPTPPVQCRANGIGCTIDSNCCSCNCENQVCRTGSCPPPSPTPASPTPPSNPPPPSPTGGSCTVNGESCGTSAECCSSFCNSRGTCRNPTNPPPAPTPPSNPPPPSPTGSCTVNGENCGASAECCSSFCNSRGVCRNPTNPAPTPQTNPPPSPTGSCVDDPNWTYMTHGGNLRDCGWVANDPSSRCDKMGDNGVPATEGCCNACANRRLRRKE